MSIALLVGEGCSWCSYYTMSSSSQVPDIFIKPLTKKSFLLLWTKLGIWPLALTPSQFETLWGQGEY